MIVEVSAKVNAREAHTCTAVVRASHAVAQSAEGAWRTILVVDWRATPVNGVELLLARDCWLFRTGVCSSGEEWKECEEAEHDVQMGVK